MNSKENTKSLNQDNESFQENTKEIISTIKEIKNNELNLFNFSLNKNKNGFIENNCEDTKTHEENQDTQKILINYNCPEFKAEIFSLFDSQNELNFFKDNSSKDSLKTNEKNSKENEFSFQINCKNTSLEPDFHLFNNIFNFENSNNDSLNNNCTINNSMLITNEQEQEKEVEDKQNKNEEIQEKIFIKDENGENKDIIKIDINTENDLDEKIVTKVNTDTTDNSMNNNYPDDDEKNSYISININENNGIKYPKRNRGKNKNKRKAFTGKYNEKNKSASIDLDESEDDLSNKKEEFHKYKYPKIKKAIKTKKERHSFFGWYLCYPNILLDKYALAFSLTMDREYPKVKKFLVYHGKKDTFAFIKLLNKISYIPNPNKQLYFNFGEHTPEVIGVKSWRRLIKKINNKNNIEDYFTNIDIKNVIKGKPMRHNMFFKKDPQDQDETCFNDVVKIPQIKMAQDYIRNIIAQKKCDYNKKCFWIKYDKNVDLSHVLELNNEEVYVKALNHSWENYSDQKTVIVLLKENDSEEIGQFLKMWTENDRIIYSNGNYDIAPVHYKVVIFSFWTLDEYFKDGSFCDLNLKLRFKKLEIKSGTDIKKFIEEISKEC